MNALPLLAEGGAGLGVAVEAVRCGRCEAGAFEAGAVAVRVSGCRGAVDGAGAVLRAFAGGVSAGFVTVPLSEKSRSWDGPIESSELLLGGAIVMFVAGASAFWASAGATRPPPRATAKEITRNLAFMLTRWTLLEPRPTAATPAL